MKLGNLNPYRDLTALHEGWGWGSRISEILAWTVSLLVIGPIQLLYWITESALSRLWNGPSAG